MTPSRFKGIRKLPSKELVLQLVANGSVVINGQTVTYDADYLYIVDNTQAEDDAVNSGITSAKVGAYDAHLIDTNNPHSVTASQVGLGSVVNTADSDTPVSGGTTKFTTGGAYTELNKKVDKVSDANKVYGTDGSGNQTTYNKNELGQIIQYSTIPTASASLLGTIIQYTGATTSGYTNGYFYKCVETSSVYSWEEIVFGRNMNVVQTTGQSTTDVMSQKAVTDAIASAITTTLNTAV